MAKQSYSLYELNEYIKRVMALNFSEPIWINCEIAQIKEARGNYYLELVEQDDMDNTKAQISAAIWYRSFLFIKNKLGALTNSLLTSGTHVQLKVQVDFNERYGLKLIIEDIDPSYTMGKLELARQNVLERLKAEGVTNLNKEIKIPAVIQKIAVISSETAAGYQDFITQCRENSYGYHIEITLFKAALQGQNTEREVSIALDEIKSKSGDYDAIAIIRGGGSKLDLSFFDNFNIGYKIATSPLPVITGIGHEIDSSVADLMACISLKTPTAVADFLIEKMAHFESSLIDISLNISNIARQQIKHNELELQYTMQTIVNVPRHLVLDQKNYLNTIIHQIETSVDVSLKSMKASLISIDAIIKANDPITIMNKGYATITQGKKLITNKEQIISGDIAINFKDGTISATIKN